MKRGYLSQYFDKVAFKSLGAVETNYHSHQHEFNGVKEIREMLGKPNGKTRYSAIFVYLTDEEDDPLTEEGTLTWYDARENHPARTEWRLYYSPNTPMQHAEEGDALFIAKSSSTATLLVVIAEKDSTASTQLQWLFGIRGKINPTFSVRA